jgi:prenyltransferase beta subunit
MALITADEIEVEFIGKSKTNNRRAAEEMCGSSVNIGVDVCAFRMETPFLFEQHVAYIKAISHDTTSFEYTASQHFRMSGVYWGLTALSLLGKDVNTEMDVSELKVWVMQCQHTSGGYSYSFLLNNPH